MLEGGRSGVCPTRVRSPTPLFISTLNRDKTKLIARYVKRKEKICSS